MTVHGRHRAADRFPPVQLMDLVVTGVGVVAGAARSAEELLAGVDVPAAEQHYDRSMPDPACIVGKRGLRYKDRASQLAWCAAELALQAAGLLDEEHLTPADERTATVVSSNLGNADTVINAMTTIELETVSGTSPMDLPNASSNVIASTVAIRFGLRGPNLMTCNGATSGLDALNWAAVLLRSGRADRAVVVGVEPANDITRAINGTDEVLDGGAAIILESSTSALARGARPLALLGPYARHGRLDRTMAALSAAGVPAWFSLVAVPPAVATADGATASDALPAGPRLDLSATFGAASGALGILQVAAAVAHIERGGGPVLAVTGHDGADSTAALVMLPAAA